MQVLQSFHLGCCWIIRICLFYDFEPIMILQQNVQPLLAGKLTRIVLRATIVQLPAETPGQLPATLQPTPGWAE